MKIIVIAAIARNGVIGRSKKPCGCCLGSGWDSDLYASHECNTCGGDSATGKRGTGFVPCNELPWPPGTYPEDMEHFKKVTMGHAVVMGRNTWKSIPRRFRPLPGRDNVVVTSSPISLNEAYADRHGHAQAWDTPKLKHAIEAMRARKHEKLYVIGGARLYAEALSIADELDLTLIDKDYEGDVYFPTRHLALDVARSIGWSDQEGRHSDFVCVERRQGTTPDLTFTRWVRR